MAEFFVAIPLDVVPSVPQLVQETIGQPITGVIINGPLPVGLTFKVCRKGGSDGVVLAGSPSPVQGGDALLDFFCPPAVEGLAVIWDVAAPGQFARICAVSAGDGSLTRV